MAQSNPRGIPKSPFIHDVAEHVGPGDTESTLNALQELLSKYQFMQSSLSARQQNMSSKAREFEETLSILDLFAQSASVSTFDLELNDTLYVKGQVKPDPYFSLWLGANTMLSYSADEARLLLENKRKAAQTNAARALEDLGWIQEQITVTQVNIARVYNWDVRKRRKQG